MARHIPFHDAVIVCFWRALNGNRGSGAAGGGGSAGPNVLLPPDFVLAANLPNSQPILYYARIRRLTEYVLYISFFLSFFSPFFYLSVFLSNCAFAFITLSRITGKGRARFSNTLFWPCLSSTDISFSLNLT